MIKAIDVVLRGRV